MKKIIIILIVFHCVFASVEAQQEIILSKYTFNSLFFNPAYAGSHGHGQGTIIAQHRRQWLDLEGAPSTYLIGAEASLFEDRVGLGLSFGKETIGIESRTDVYGNYAYRIKTGNGSFAMGLRTGLSLFGTDFSKLVLTDPQDNIFDRPDLNIAIFNVGLGAFYKEDDMYFGISVPSLMSVGPSEGSALKVRHYYIHGGLMIGGGDNSDFGIEPALLMKFQKAVPVQFTLGVNLWYKEKVAIGASWRSSDAIALLFEIKLDRKYRLAFAYDFTLSDIRRVSNGTPEIMLGYNFNYLPQHEKIRNIRHGGRF